MSFLETDEFGNLVAVPKLPSRSRVEAIFLVLPEEIQEKSRMPRADLVGKAHIKGDLLSPVIVPADWDATR